MAEAVGLCRENFQKFWGQQLNTLKALHAIRYDEETNLAINEEV